MNTFRDYWMYPLFIGGKWEPSALHNERAEVDYKRECTKDAGYRVGKVQRVTIEYEVPKR